MLLVPSQGLEDWRGFLCFPWPGIELMAMQRGRSAQSRFGVRGGVELGEIVCLYLKSTLRGVCSMMPSPFRVLGLPEERPGNLISGKPFILVHSGGESNLTKAWAVCTGCVQF